MPSYIMAGKWPGQGEHELGVFTINGFTRETSVNEEGKNKDVYLKNVGDKATLWFTLKQDIASLNGNSKLQINEDKDGWDQEFEVEKTNFKRGTLIIRYKDYEGADDSEIKQAEEELGLKFSKEYKDYLKEFGAACANGHEITGLVKSARLNVVAATQKAKTKNPSIPDNLYLIEDLGTDKILTWQEASGILYQSVGTNEVERIKKNFCDYIGS